jgi:hypothetical protein
MELALTLPVMSFVPVAVLSGCGILYTDVKAPRGWRTASM